MEQDAIGTKTTTVGSGSCLVAKSVTPLAAGETRQIGPVWTRDINTLGIDIAADQACTLQIIRLPDGATPGEASPAVAVNAGSPAYHTYSALFCPAVRIEVVNTSGSAMTSFALHVRGGA